MKKLNKKRKDHFNYEVLLVIGGGISYGKYR